MRNASSGPAHHRRTEDDRIGERRPHRQLALAALADVERRRRRIGADSRDLDEALDAGPLRLTCHSLGGLDVHGVKRVPPALDIKADRIDRAGSAGERIGDGLLVVDIGLDRLQQRIIGTEQFAAALRMPGGNPNRNPVLAQAANHAAAEKAGAAENGDDADAHRGIGAEAMSPPGGRPSAT